MSAFAYELAATGATLNLWIPIIAGVLLVGGAAAIIIPRLRRAKSTSAAQAAVRPEVEQKPFDEDRTV